MPDATTSQPPKRLDDVRKVLGLHHDSMHTERSSVEWSIRFARFHGMRSRADRFPAATQYVAVHALVFLYKRVRNHAMEGHSNAVCADTKTNVPVGMARAEVAAILSLLDGTAQLVATLLYGSELRVMEVVQGIRLGGRPVTS